MHLPWEQPSYGATKRKKKTKKKVRKKTKKKAATKKLPLAPRKKTKKRARAASCDPREAGVEPPVYLATKRRKRAGKVKTKKVKVPKKCKTRKAPKPGKDVSGWLYPACSDRAATIAQREEWKQGLIPSAYPNGPYKPGKTIKHGKKLTASKWPVPPAHGMPDVRWFVDPEVAGRKAGKIIVAFSGGKDSMATLLYLIEVCLSQDLDPGQVIECWHHSVDGRPLFFGGAGVSEFDWPVTEDYCRVICACLGIPLFFSWRVGGLMAEVLKGGDDDPLLKVWPADLRELKTTTRDKYLKAWGKEPIPGKRFTAPMILEMPGRNGNYLIIAGGLGKKDPKTGEMRRFARRSFPVPGGILSGRWCSSVAKIDVGRSQLRNRTDLEGRRVLFVTGERAEESPARAKYSIRELEKALGHGSSGRHVERWRPVLKWCEIDVWAIIRRWSIRPHPCYQIGWGRLSCMTCIFGSNVMWASVKEIDPARFQRFVDVENMLMQEKQILLRAAQKLPKGAKRDGALKEARSRIAWIDRDEPLKDRARPRWRLAKPLKETRDYIKKGELPPGVTDVREKEVTYTTPKGNVLTKTVYEVYDDAQPFKEVLMPRYQKLIDLALSHHYTADPLMDPWKLPAGAFGESAGPT
jgi:3'-phosphoadenosine 5'-phosphosulfate sulfotransferase (PAPS reductase)/FAD synthetase